MSSIDQYGYGYEYNIGDKIGRLVGTTYKIWMLGRIWGLDYGVSEGYRVVMG